MFTEHPVIDFMPDQREMEDKGGTMRLGLYPARLTPGSKAAAVYGQEVIYERHRHRFEVNNRLSPDARGSRHDPVRPVARRPPRRDRRAARTTRGSSPASSTRSSSPARSDRIRCSTGSSRRRSPCATVASPSSRSAPPKSRSRRRLPRRPTPSSPSPAPDLATRPDPVPRLTITRGRSRRPGRDDRRIGSPCRAGCAAAPSRDRRAGSSASRAIAAASARRVVRRDDEAALAIATDPRPDGAGRPPTGRPSMPAVHALRPGPSWRSGRRGCRWSG